MRSFLSSHVKSWLQTSAIMLVNKDLLMKSWRRASLHAFLMRQEVGKSGPRVSSHSLTKATPYCFGPFEEDVATCDASCEWYKEAVEEEEDTDDDESDS